MTQKTLLCMYIHNKLDKVILHSKVKIINRYKEINESNSLALGSETPNNA